MKSDTLTHHESRPAGDQGIYDALILDARLRQSLATARSLGSRGLRVAALETADALPAATFSSRWCHHSLVCPAPEGTKDYLMYLEQFLKAPGARVLISTADGTIALLREHREQLERRVCLALAKEPALGIAINKEQTLAVAQQLGISVPRAVPLRSVREVDIALREIGLPAVVKPVESWDGGIRVISELVTTPEEARRAVERLTCSGGTVLFQEYLSGRRESLSFFYANGDIYARFAFWGKLTHPPLGGVYVLRQSIAMPPDTGQQAERLVREIELEGYAQVEFRRDSAGKPYLMEINPRLNLAIAHAVHAGVDFPYLLYQWASGERLTAVTSYHIGSQMRNLGGDLLSLAASVQQRGRPGVRPPARALLEFLLAFLVPMDYDYLDWKDPLPVLPAMKGFVHTVLRRIGKSLSERFSRRKVL